MNVRFPFMVLLGVFLVSLGFVIGCGQQNQVDSGQNVVPPVSGGDQADEVDPHDVPLTEEQKQHNIDNRIPLHREGTPEEVAELIGQLVANDYITGETIAIDGGLTMRIA